MPELDEIAEELSTIAQKVRELRAQRKFSQAALARRAGVARQTLLDLEAADDPSNAIKAPSLVTLKRIATALDVPVVQLLDGSGRVIASYADSEDRLKLLKIAKIIGPVSGPEHND